MKDVYVHVQFGEDSAWHEWRLVKAESLNEAISIAESMPDVTRVLEASWIPGGVVT